MNNKKPPLVSSLAVSFKKATQLSDNVAEVKTQHRTNLKTLIDDYMQQVSEGKAQGIRTAKELVEVIKTDLLLLGEATERTENTDNIDEVRVQKLTRMMDENSDQVQAMMDSIFKTLNSTNDNIDDLGTVVEEDEEDLYKEFVVDENTDE